MSAPTATATAQAIRALAQQPPDDPKARQELYHAAQELLYAVEPPHDTDYRLFFATAQTNWVQAAYEMRIFHTLAAAPTKAWRVTELAEPCCNAEPALLHRMCRYVHTLGLLTEVAEATYQANRLTLHLATPGFAAGLAHHANMVNPSSAALASFLRETGYRDPSDATDTPLRRAFGMPIMEYLHSHPDEAGQAFQYMAYYRRHAVSPFDETPFEQDFRLEETEMEKGRVMMVDVGGGSGHQCFAVREAFEAKGVQWQGKLVVQDMPIMIDMIDRNLTASINLTPVAHDFFTPQTIQGAKVYYLRTVLHDWPALECRTILAHLRDAMAPDSVLIIDENIVPATGASFKQMAFDLTMMSCLSARERSEKQWRELLGEVGLRVRDVWVYDEDFWFGWIIAVRE